SLGSAFAVVRGDPFLVAAAGTFASVFAPIALAGPAALLAALRIARFRPGSSRGVAA
ncbi:MAG: hypothetical protein HY557_08445, partial [Euryarchaeota archaeon]|nr:hypothetical protein [Euryarchaeota archaeon]